MGHEVVLFSLERGRIAFHRRDSRLREQFSQEMLDTFHREHKKKHFDLFFAYLIEGMVEPAVIDRIRKTGVPTCNFSCNNTHQFYLVQNLSRHFDFSLHSEKPAREKFLAVGAKPIWWPMASNPKYFKPYNVARTVPVSFVGANYALRGRHIGHLLHHGIDVHAYGPGWRWGAQTPFGSFAKRIVFMARVLAAREARSQASTTARLAEHSFNRLLYQQFPDNLHGVASDDDMIQLYSRSQISLGFLEVHENNDPSSPVSRHLHLRDFEAPMSGALYCTGYMDELAEFFVPDREVITYRNEDELLGKVKYYLAHPDDAERIRQAGYQRALAEHTYHARYAALFRAIGLQQ
jgi:spore maturation protein CgeB